jgi:cell division protein FtsA
MRNMNREIRAIGLDIGTSKVRCVVGEPSDDGKMNIIGIGEAEARGLRRGIVTGAEAVSESIKKPLGDAERISRIEIKSPTHNHYAQQFRG